DMRITPLNSIAVAAQPAMPAGRRSRASAVESGAVSVMDRPSYLRVVALLGVALALAPTDASFGPGSPGRAAGCPPAGVRKTATAVAEMRLPGSGRAVQTVAMRPVSVVLAATGGIALAATATIELVNGDSQAAAWLLIGSAPF